jgi:MFS family permease
MTDSSVKRLPLHLWQALATAFGSQLLFQLMTSSPAYFAPVAAPDIGVGEQWVGGMFTILGLAGIGVATASTAVFGRVGLIRYMQLGMLLTALAMLLGATANAWLILLAAALFGIAQGPSTPASAYLISRTAPPDKLSLATSLQQCGPPMAWALGGVLVPALIGLLGWRWAAAAMAVPCIIGALLLQPIRAKVDRELRTGANLRWRDVVDPVLMCWREPRLRPICITGLVLCLLHQSFLSFTVVYMTVELQLTLATAGIIMTAAQVCGITMRLTLGWGADRVRNDFLLLGLVMLCAATGFAVFSLMPRGAPVWMVMAVCVLLGTATAGWQGMFFAANIRHAPPGKTMMALAGVQFYMFAGFTGGPVVVAALISVLRNYAVAYGLLATVGVVAGAYALRLSAAERHAAAANE